MGSEQPCEDQALLARLEGLRQGTSIFRPSPIIIHPDVEAGSDETPQDLIARFERLHGRPTVKQQDVEDTSAQSAKDDDFPSPTLEELLAELETMDSYKVEEADIKEAQDLMAEARRAIPDEPDAQNNDLKDEASERKYVSQINDEDSEAQAALQRILDEAEDEEEIVMAQHERTSPAVSELQRHLQMKQTRCAEPESFAALQFPNIPDKTSDILDLPSVPKNAPTTRTGQARAPAPTSADHDVDSWCVICCNNATVQCFGCDKDLYCWVCWREGHTGEDAGLEEKQHVWERYRKPGISR